MSEIVLASAKQTLFKDSLLFLFDLAYKIRFSLPLLLFASFLGFDFQIIVSEEDDEDDDEDDGNQNNQNGFRNIVYNLNLRVEELEEESNDESLVTVFGSMSSVSDFED